MGQRLPCTLPQTTRHSFSTSDHTQPSKNAHARTHAQTNPTTRSYQLAVESQHTCTAIEQSQYPPARTIGCLIDRDDIVIAALCIHRFYRCLPSAHSPQRTSRAAHCALFHSYSECYCSLLNLTDNNHSRLRGYSAEDLPTRFLL